MAMTALIVEDEVEANRLLAQLVELGGCRAESAYTGSEALAIAREHPPDIIFLDLMLPDTTGYDVCRALKSRRHTAPIPIVVVTARLATESRMESFRVGATDFLTKPYTPDQIFDALSCAEKWREAIELGEASGLIRLETPGDTEPFERIGWLQSLLMAHTPWDESQVALFRDHLVALAQALLDWGRQNRLCEVASLHFEVRPERFELHVVDLVGWGRDPQSAGAKALRQLTDSGLFDSADDLESADGVAFTKRFDLM
jgi:CheY-like chemotaxis protein